MLHDPGLRRQLLYRSTQALHCKNEGSTTGYILTISVCSAILKKTILHGLENGTRNGNFITAHSQAIRADTCHVLKVHNIGTVGRIELLIIFQAFPPIGKRLLRLENASIGKMNLLFFPEAFDTDDFFGADSANVSAAQLHKERLS